MNVFTTMKEKQTLDKPIKWIDARFSLQNPKAGEQAYSQDHIEGAVHWDLEKNLSDMQKTGGRHPLPDQDALTEMFQTSGLELDDHIVVYDDGGEPFAARAWWILKYAGFKHVSISIEGFDELKNFGYLTKNKISKRPHSTVEPKWNELMLATKQDVKEVISAETGEMLLDARAAARYRGEHEPLDAIAGHIPSAHNFDWAQLVTEGKLDVTGEAAKQLLDIAESGKPITVYCGSGVTAAPLYAMLVQQGRSNVRLYAGSYSDWIEDGDLEVATGESL